MTEWRETHEQALAKNMHPARSSGGKAGPASQGVLHPMSRFAWSR